MAHEKDVTIDRPDRALLSSFNSFNGMFSFLFHTSVRGSVRFGVVFSVLLLMLMLSLGACASTTSRPTGPVTLSRTAKVNYDRGMAELKAKSHDRARRYFKHIQREFPYSRYATLSELRMADCDFSEENYAEAAAAYRRFVRLHRTHAEADHAAYHRGLSFHKMIPSDWFLVPPSFERDMSATRDALRELRSFLRQFPESDYREEATELVRNCIDRLAQHEMYVARFYLRRSKHKAAIGRTQVVEEHYRESKLVPEAIFIRGETYLNMDDIEAARQTFLKLASEYPESAESGRAREYLRHLGMSEAEITRALEPEDDGNQTVEGDEAGSGDEPVTADQPD